MTSEDALKRNIRQYWKYAEMAYENSDYNTSIIMHYKCMVACADLNLFRKFNSIPSNHSKRFRSLENNFPDFYEKLDRNFSYYRDSYELEISENIAERVRKDVLKLIEKLEIKTGRD